MASWPPLALALGAALAMMTLVWVASLVKRDASIIDVFWGQGEDYRYREMRERNPATFPVRSLLTVFWLQAVLLWAISAPHPSRDSAEAVGGRFRASREEGAPRPGPASGSPRRRPWSSLPGRALGRRAPRRGRSRMPRHP